MKAFHDMLRNLEVIVQMSLFRRLWQSSENSSWVLLRSKFTVGMGVTMPHALYDWLIPWGSWRWTCLFLRQPSNSCVVMPNRRPSSHRAFWSQLGSPFFLPYKELFLGSQDKKIAPLDFFYGAWWGWGVQEPVQSLTHSKCCYNGGHHRKVSFTSKKLFPLLRLQQVMRF